MNRQATAAIYAWDNAHGLTRDLRIVRGLLEEAGYRVTVEPIPRRERAARYRAMVRRWWRRPVRDINVFLETPVPSAFHRARLNVLIPNQEWFDPVDTVLLRFIDIVACRTRLCERLFGALGVRTEYVGFTSDDRSDASVAPRDRILHVAGRSHFKGTVALLAAWRAHPEWPTLTLVHHTNVAPVDPSIPNVEQITAHIPDEEFRQLQQRAWLTIQPSEAEGFGHCLVEALSTGTLLMTIDAAPMNEIVTVERGMLVPWRGAEPMGIDRRYFVDAHQLEVAIAACLAAGPEGLRDRMTAGQDWFRSNGDSFRARFLGFATELRRQSGQRNRVAL
jgi:hypothetical protein